MVALFIILILGKYSQCHSCDASCKTCFGPQALDCSTCFKGTQIFPVFSHHDNKLKHYPSSFGALYVCICVFTGYFLGQDSSCVVQCPSGSYANSATQLCEDCSPNCEACVDTSDNCISCSRGSFKLFLHQGRCWSNCQE